MKNKLKNKFNIKNLFKGKLNDKSRIIILVILAIIIILLLILGVTYAFMKPINEGSKYTNMSAKACAKIQFTDTPSSVINLTNTKPMSIAAGLNTTPYTFKVSSTCDSYVDFVIFLASTESDTLYDIRYVLTKKNSKIILSTGSILYSDTQSLSEDELSELKISTGLSNIYDTKRVFRDSLPLKSFKEYDLYLWVDSEVDNSYMNKNATIAVGIKSFDRDQDWIDNCSGREITSSCINANISDAKTAYTTTKTKKQIVDPLCTNQSLTTCIKNLKVVDDAILLHDSNLTNGAVDNSYRYSGATANVNNYVCFGPAKTVTAKYGDLDGNDSVNSRDALFVLRYMSGTEEFNDLQKAQADVDQNGIIDKTDSDHILSMFGQQYTPPATVGNFTLNCHEDNLYRIIGVFDNQVKLIKASAATSDLLGTDGNYGGSGNTYAYEAGTWNTQYLNTLNLNTNYLNNIGSEWSDQIATHTWYVGGSLTTTSAKTIYNTEVGSSRQNYSDSKKVGLMYLSDYLYAGDKSYWTTPTTTMTNNWISGIQEWTITPTSNSSDYKYYINTNKYGQADGTIDVYQVRPVIYLNTNTPYISGTGTQNNPFRIR